jgi:hypothetical protein
MECTILATPCLDIPTLVLILTLAVLLFQVVLLKRQTSIMRKQNEIADRQLKWNEAVALSLEVNLISPRQPRELIVNAKNEGKGIAHDPIIDYYATNDKKERIYSGTKRLQTLGPGSKQTVIMTFPTERIPRESILHLKWSAKASDGTRYRGKYKMPVDHLTFVRMPPKHIWSPKPG